MTPIKDVNPMMNDMAIKGRCISIWHSHKLNEEHEPYSLDCIFQDVEVCTFICESMHIILSNIDVSFNFFNNMNRMNEFRFTLKRNSCLNLNLFFKRDIAI